MRYSKKAKFVDWGLTTFDTLTGEKEKNKFALQHKKKIDQWKINPIFKLHYFFLYKPDENISTPSKIEKWAFFGSLMAFTKDLRYFASKTIDHTNSTKLSTNIMIWKEKRAATGLQTELTSKRSWFVSSLLQFTLG